MSPKVRYRGWIIYLLGFYVTVQFAWWAFMLIELNQELYNLHFLTITQGEIPRPEQLILIADIKNDLGRRIWMVLGEGSVFIVLLFLGFRKVRSAIVTEMELARQQNNFLLSVTHELKSPLAALRLQLQTLRARKLDHEKQQQILALSEKETERLTYQIEDLLLTARMDSGRGNLNIGPLHISHILTKMVKERYSEPLAAGQISVDIQSNLKISGDEQAIQSIVSNLVDNALKYAGDKSLIKIQLFQNKDDVIIKVSDNGPGVSISEQKKVFDRFYRTGNEQTRKSKGTGLGLYIVNQLVKEHNGEITLKNAAPTGCVFEVSLPILDEN